MTTLERVLAHYDDEYGARLGMTPMPVLGPVREDVEILRAYLGTAPGRSNFGRALVVLRAGERCFLTHFSVHRPHQRPADANRLVDIAELVTRTYRAGDEDVPLLETAETDFGVRAFWARTPLSELDKDARAVRAVEARLREYSVANQLCRKFRARKLPAGERA